MSTTHQFCTFTLHDFTFGIEVQAIQEVKTMCGHLGYTTDLAENGAEVLHQLEAKTYDLILLDVQMPVLDGLATAEEICRRFPDRARRPRLIAITASVQPGDRERCLAAGMDDYLSKPVLPKTLALCIERICGKNSAAPMPDAVAALIPGPDVPLVDLAHLQAITEGLDEEQAAEFGAMLSTSVKSDFLSMRRRLTVACEARHAGDLANSVHGLKGCVFSAGWARMGQYCASQLAALRENRFSDWATLPAELDRYFTVSSAEMDRVLADRAHKTLLENTILTP